MKEKQIQDAYMQIAALSALIFSISLYIYVVIGFLDILTNGKNSKVKTKKLYKTIILASTISLIVSIYFFIKSYEDYIEYESKTTFDYYMADTLSLSAQSIRINTLLKYPDKILGAEDFQ